MAVDDLERASRAFEEALGDTGDVIDDVFRLGARDALLPERALGRVDCPRETVHTQGLVEPS